MHRVGEQGHGSGERTRSCTTAVAAMTIRLILTARMPWVLPSRAESTESALSWLCGGRRQQNT